MKTNVICISPVKNEAWILKHFIECAREWADVIILGDHNSTDDSVAFARQYDNVRIVHHDLDFDEGARRKLLTDEARKIAGRRLIVAIDADEMLSANWNRSPEWPRMLSSPPGTRFVFDWVELMPGLQRYTASAIVAAMIDDETEYVSVPIHSRRVPVTSGEAVKLTDIKLLHYISIDPQRMLSKLRWYKCLETIEFSARAWDLCVSYHDTTVEAGQPTLPVQEEWIDGYQWLDQYRTASCDTGHHWWDEEVLAYFDSYGTRRFRRLNIWDVDWSAKAQAMGMKRNYNDPRSRFEVAAHRFIEKHARELRLRKRFVWKLFNKLVRPLVSVLGW